MGKPRSDSPLKNLSPERQEQIIEWCNTPKSDDCVGGYKYAKQQLVADGLKVSESALSDFYSWWHLQKTFQQADSLTSDIEELLTRKFPDVDPQKISDLGQVIFTLQAANARNAEEFREMEYLKLAKQTATTRGRQKEEELQLKKAKFQRDTAELFIKWSADERARQILASGATHSEKIEALGRAMFEDWDES